MLTRVVCWSTAGCCASVYEHSRYWFIVWTGSWLTDWLTYTGDQNSSWEANRPSSGATISPPIMEPESSCPCVQQPATVPNQGHTLPSSLQMIHFFFCCLMADTYNLLCCMLQNTAWWWPMFVLFRQVTCVHFYARRHKFCEVTLFLMASLLAPHGDTVSIPN